MSYTSQVGHKQIKKILIGLDAVQVTFKDLVGPKSDFFFDPLSEQEIRKN